MGISDNDQTEPPVVIAGSTAGGEIAADPSGNVQRSTPISAMKAIKILGNRVGSRVAVNIFLTMQNEEAGRDGVTGRPLH
jgi:hypothetical protein